MVGVKFGQPGDAERTALAREQAIRESGMAFTELRLSAQEFNGACGAEILYSTPHTDPLTRVTRFSVEVKGGPLKFAYDPLRGGSFTTIPDTEWNRNFLRGILDAGVVEIVDKNVEADIRNSVPAPSTGAGAAAPAVSSPPRPQTIAELTAALNAARAAQGLPPVDSAGKETLPPQPVVEVDSAPPSVTLPPQEPATASANTSAAPKRGGQRTPKSALLSVKE